MDEIYNSDGDASDGNSSDNDANSCYYSFIVWSLEFRLLYLTVFYLYNQTRVLFYMFCNERR